MGNKKLVITLIIVVAVLIVALAGAIVYIVIDKNSDTDSNTKVANNNKESEIENEYTTEDETENIQDSINEQVKDTFNAQFEIYKGEECSPADVKSLLNKVEASNSVSDNYVSLNSMGITDKSNVDNSKKYSVELFYNDNGYVEEITILEKESTDNNEELGDTSNDLAKAIFNDQFTSYLGKITGAQLNSLLSTIQTSNSANPEHQISLTSNNLQDLNGILETDEYVITLTYDDNKYVSNINIDKNNV